MTEDEMVGWHHRLNGYELEETLRDGEGQESLVCCGAWGLSESDVLSYWTELNTQQGSQEWPIWKGQPLQQMVHGKLGKYMQNNEIERLSYTTQKK